MANSFHSSDIPYKIYLSEDELPQAWYNVRAALLNCPPKIDAQQTFLAKCRNARTLCEKALLMVWPFLATSQRLAQTVYLGKQKQPVY